MGVTIYVLDCCLMYEYRNVLLGFYFFFFSSRRRHTRCGRDWSSDVCSSDLKAAAFDLLKPSVDKSEESVRGIYLCNPDEAIILFKTLIPKNLPNVESIREKEEIGRASCRERV